VYPRRSLSSLITIKVKLGLVDSVLPSSCRKGEQVDQILLTIRIVTVPTSRILRLDKQFSSLEAARAAHSREQLMGEIQALRGTHSARRSWVLWVGEAVARQI